eukprot:CAMPEP_0197414828 /NCGR_PEP_ID=MMETSP1170-20131217/1500_1 /TAXON_ID=54406 /ORGANISM="Sarcinochrysis sp, Strain CCMP770" /LENGTH=97 /DNA_ID=CAMNT_0042941581 /DNA_START=417 /DNA_END=707 /DNA_ORIENTATION=-
MPQSQGSEHRRSVASRALVLNSLSRAICCPFGASDDSRSQNGLANVQAGPAKKAVDMGSPSSTQMASRIHELCQHQLQRQCDQSDGVLRGSWFVRDH